MMDAGGLSVSVGTKLTSELAISHGKPLLQIDPAERGAIACAVTWLRVQQQAHGPGMALAIGGPRESEVSGIYTRAKLLFRAVLEERRDLDLC